jgi:hypothetical protein
MTWSPTSLTDAVGKHECGHTLGRQWSAGLMTCQTFVSSPSMADGLTRMCSGCSGWRFPARSKPRRRRTRGDAGVCRYVHGTCPPGPTRGRLRHVPPPRGACLCDRVAVVDHPVRNRGRIGRKRWRCADARCHRREGARTAGRRRSGPRNQAADRWSARHGQRDDRDGYDRP